MYRKYKRSKQVFIAGLALLVVGAGAALAMHNPTIAKLADASLSAVVLKQAAPKLATNRPLVKIFLSGTLDRNHENVSVDKVGAVQPGEVVRFTVNSVNEGSAPARDYRAIGQIPSGTIFIGGSALADGATQVNYSIDGGQSFSTQPMIEEKQPDGTVKKVVAPVSMYTQVRFEWADPLAAGGKLVASYRVRVK